MEEIKRERERERGGGGGGGDKEREREREKQRERQITTYRPTHSAFDVRSALPMSDMYLNFDL